jgi:hypothetical protein
MTTAGYLEYDASTRRFSLPAEHGAAVAEEGGPFFFGGVYEMIPALVAVMDQPLYYCGQRWKFPAADQELRP